MSFLSTKLCRRRRQQQSRQGLFQTFLFLAHISHSDTFDVHNWLVFFLLPSHLSFFFTLKKTPDDVMIFRNKQDEHAGVRCCLHCRHHRCSFQPPVLLKPDYIPFYREVPLSLVEFDSFYAESRRLGRLQRSFLSSIELSSLIVPFEQPFLKLFDSLYSHSVCPHRSSSNPPSFFNPVEESVPCSWHWFLPSHTDKSKCTSNIYSLWLLQSISLWLSRSQRASSPTLSWAIFFLFLIRPLDFLWPDTGWKRGRNDLGAMEIRHQWG